MLFHFGPAPSPGPWADRLIARLQGWQQLGVEAGSALGEVPRPQSTFILTFNRQLASELAFYVPGQPKGLRLACSQANPRASTIYGTGPKIGWDALIVVPEPIPRALLLQSPVISRQSIALTTHHWEQQGVATTASTLGHPSKNGPMKNNS